MKKHYCSVVVTSAALLAFQLGAEAAPPRWKPSAHCQASADAACNADPSVFGPTVDHNHSCYVDIRARPCDGPMVARKSLGKGSDEAMWRCYSPSTLSPDGSSWKQGGCYCSLDPQLRSVLKACGTPDPTPPPVAPPTPAPSPPAAGGVQVFTAGQEGYHTYRIPAVVKSAKDPGTLLCFAEGRKLSSADHGFVDIVVKTSTDGGASWGPLRVVHSESSASQNKFVTIGNPAPVVVASTPGKVVLVFCRNNAQVLSMTSADFGQTWSAPKLLEAANPKHGANGSWPWVATGPPQGMQLPNGRLIVGSDHRGFPASNHALVYSHAMYSDDFGDTWQLSDSIAGGNECQVAVLPNGTAGHPDGSLLIHMRSPSGQRHVSWSTDSGAHWSPPSPVMVGGLAKYGGATCEGSTITAGRDTLLFSSPFSKGRENMTVFKSETGGRSWEVLQHIDSGPSAYSALVTLNGTTAGLVYESGGYGALTLRFVRFA